MTFPTEVLSPADVAVVETFVVPRYLSLFGNLALEMLLPCPEGRIAHLGCRTGYLDADLVRFLGTASLVGIDCSPEALDLARNKAAMSNADLQYLEVTELPSPLDGQSFSHVVALHPIGDLDERGELLNEMAGLLYAGGQALVALPMRGSFVEIADLLREYALKFDDGDLGKAVDLAWGLRPTIESLSEELEGVGLEDVDVELRPMSLSFDSGRAFFEDPSSRLLILPEIRRSMAGHDLKKPLEYVREAIDRYWSETKFELSVVVGCAGARRVD